MMSIRPSRPDDGARVMDIWRAAVDATHDFLSPQDRREIETMVAGFLPRAPLWVAVDDTDRAIGFMLIDDGHMEALFIDPVHRGTGIGRALVEQGLRLHPGMTTDVNAQNGQAVDFYRLMGFQETGRSERDAEGRPYPLIHLRHPG